MQIVRYKVLLQKFNQRYNFFVSWCRLCNWSEKWICKSHKF